MESPTMKTLTQPQAEALTTLITTLRPDWDERGILATLRNIHPTRDAWAICHAALTAAANPSNRTPKVLEYEGAHWATLQTVRQRVDPTAAVTQPCQDHPHYQAQTCPSCWGDVHAGTRTPGHVGKHTT